MEACSPPRETGERREPLGLTTADLLRLIVGVCFVTCIGADAGDEFSNNLFSEMAPCVLHPAHCDLRGGILTLRRA